MEHLPDIPEGWEGRGKPPTLFRRFEFARYAETRDFLDKLAALTEHSERHPQNINFGAGYVNITIDAAGDSLGVADYDFARAIDSLLVPDKS